MGKTKIEWTNFTWNPCSGCTKISAGCKNCYAERMAKRLAGKYGYPEQPHHFDVTLHPDKLNQPYKWRKPRRIFVCSMGDLFHEDVGFEYILKVWKVMAINNHHTFQILTKRPEQMLKFVQWLAGADHISIAEFPQNVWIGVTAENQKTADERIPILLKIPAAVRFVSVEPMLERIDLSQYLDYNIHIGETGYENNQREYFVQHGSARRMEDRQNGESLEIKKREIDKNREQNATRVFTSSENDKRSKVAHGSTQIDLPSLQGQNTDGENHQSYQRNQGRQQTGEFRNSDIFGESQTRFQDRTKRPERAEESSEQANRHTDCGNQREIRQREYNTNDAGERIWRNISDNIENSERRQPQITEWNSGELRKTQKHQKTKKERERTIHQVICGGETGHGAREMKAEWAWNLYHQCKDAGVPFFFKKPGDAFRGGALPNIREYPKG